MKVWDTRAAIPLGATKVLSFNLNFYFYSTPHIYADAYVHWLNNVTIINDNYTE